jgi:hypothetical protein
LCAGGATRLNGHDSVTQAGVQRARRAQAFNVVTRLLGTLKTRPISSYEERGAADGGHSSERCHAELLLQRATLGESLCSPPRC